MKWNYIVSYNKGFSITYFCFILDNASERSEFQQQLQQKY